MKKFTDYAVEKMQDLYLHHDNEVGSQLKLINPDAYKDYKPTDCITYVINVLSYAFNKIGNAKAASKVWELGKHGADLSAYLVNTHAWKGIYINPDAIHPADGNSEHAFTNVLVSKTCRYYNIPITYKVVNFRPTKPSNPSFNRINPRTGTTKLDSVDIGSLNGLKFGYGISRGGMHTWLYSKGDVYEVHWSEIGANLYERSPLKKYPWLSGAIVVPPDQAALLTASAKVMCR